ncbi:hypothetical protein TWF506_011000 [Arthrobotrys conoides]|uniref:Uncharacterized protein n=1 Tax=Arthrobotrys conoides TaxID=74498 RepID=A0AAN8NPT6_9PEZI
MNTLFKAIALCTLALSATAQSPTECSPENLPTFCPAVHNSCCKYLCSGGGQPACWDRNITDTEKSPSGVRGVTCELCPTGLAYIPRESSSSAVEEPPAAAATSTSTERPREVTTKGAPPAYTPGSAEGTGNATTTATDKVLEPTATGNTSEPGIPEPTYISGASSVLAMSGTAIVGVFCFMMVL